MKKEFTGFTIKLIAAISMIIDHMASVYLPENTTLNFIMRVFIGRISLPLFLFMLVEGFKYTKNKNKHLFLLIITAIAAEIPHDLAFEGSILEFEQQNVMFTLSMAFIALILAEKIDSLKINIYAKYVGIIGMTSVISLLSYLLNMEYNWTLVVAVVFAYLFWEDRLVAILGICIFLMLFSVSEICALIAVPIILLYSGKEGRKAKKFFYILYPAHLILIFLISSLTINSHAELGDLGEPRSSFNLGTAKILEGKNIIVSMYLDTPSYKWNPDDMKKSLDSLDMACIYLQNNAQEYNMDATFIYDWTENDNLCYKAKMIMDPSDSERYEEILDKRIASWVSGVVGYQRLLKIYDADNIFMIVFINAPGRSYAITYDGIDAYEESLISFTNSAKDTKNKFSPCTLAHEILHLYGAHDYYLGAEYTNDVVEYIKKTYPDDIMLSTDNDGKITKKIGSLTAYHLGWKDKALETSKYKQLIR